MREVVLKPSRTKLIFFLALSLGFVAIGVAALCEGDLEVGISITLLFGLAALVFAIQLHPDASYLRLTPEGFYVRSLFRMSPLVPWSEAGDFRVETLPPARTRMVVYDSTNPKSQGLRKFNRAFVGATDGLPDSYGMKAEALAALMNEWRNLYAAA